MRYLCGGEEGRRYEREAIGGAKESAGVTSEGGREGSSVAERGGF